MQYYYHFHQWLSFFYFYCFFGWCFESTYVSLLKKRFVNRGFMKGPWLPLYGVGAICVLFVSLPFQDHWILVYISGAVAATILEYIVGSLMVSLFKVRYWDYSRQKFQLHGHICLTSSIAWGFLSILMVYVVHTPVANFILSLNNDFVEVITFCITLLMVYDFSRALRQALDLRDLIVQMEIIKSSISVHMELQKALVKSTAEEKFLMIKENTDSHVEYYSDQLKDKMDELHNNLLEQKYATAEQLAQFEWIIEKQSIELKKRREKILQKMQAPALYEIKNNPGFKAPSLRKEFLRFRRIMKKQEKQEKQ